VKREKMDLKRKRKKKKSKPKKEGGGHGRGAFPFREKGRGGVGAAGERRGKKISICRSKGKTIFRSPRRGGRRRPLTECLYREANRSFLPKNLHVTRGGGDRDWRVLFMEVRWEGKIDFFWDRSGIKGDRGSLWFLSWKGISRWKGMWVRLRAQASKKKRKRGLSNEM